MAGWDYLHVEHVSVAAPHCVFCHRPLKSGKALVVIDDKNERHYSGAACAKKHIGKPAETILDLTKLAALVVQAPEQFPQSAAAENGKAKKKRGQSLPDQINKADPVERYLRLRAEHMKAFVGNTTQRLSAMHADLDSEVGLSDQDAKYIENLMAKSATEKTIYAVANLERCIGLDYWLSLAIAQTPAQRQEFLVSMQKALREGWRLTVGQIGAINKWGEGLRKVIPDFPVLETTVFDGVVAPKFKRP